MSVAETARRLVFIPTYNEADNVEVLFQQIESLNLNVDFLILDDNSPDGTGAIIDRMAATNPRVHAIHRSGKLGIGSAHAEGIRWAYDRGYHILVTMDCDFTHSPDLIPCLLEHASEYEVVVGSRYLLKGSLAGWSLIRKLLTRFGHLLTATLLGMSYDATGAFRLYQLDRIPRGIFDLVYSRSYSFFFESLYLLWLNGCRIKEIPVRLPVRTYGHSKMALRDALYSFSLVLYLSAKKLISREHFLYAEPFHSAGASHTESSAEREWDEYWLMKRQPGGLIYDLIAAFYRKLIIKRTLNHFINKHFRAGSRVLHAGCGGGQVDKDIVPRFVISALDISRPALSSYRKLHGGAPELIYGSIFAIPATDAFFDGIYNLGVMEHFTEADIHRILAEFNRVLRLDGKIVLFWPPVFGISVRFLAAARWILQKIKKKEVKFHPDEITHVRSKRQIRGYLRQGGFVLDEYYFGARDLFTQVVIVGRKTETVRIPISQPTATVAACGED
jgi:dolichol-phosphate mannosyltransferase